MGTKNNQGPFNCHAAALPDEPIFILLARDPTAPATIEFWAKNRIGFGKTTTPEDIAKIEEARTIAAEMKAWREANVNPTGDDVASWRLPRNQVEQNSDRHVAAEPGLGAPYGLNLQHLRPGEIDQVILSKLNKKQETLESLIKPDEVPGHRFAHFHKGKRYAYAKGLKVSPIHLPAALDAMAESGWHLLAIFGETDSKNVGFIFQYRDDLYGKWRSGPLGEIYRPADPRMDAYESGRPLDEIRTDAAPTSATDLGQGVEP